MDTQQIAKLNQLITKRDNAVKSLSCGRPADRVRAAEAVARANVSLVAYAASIGAPNVTDKDQLIAWTTQRKTAKRTPSKKAKSAKAKTSRQRVRADGAGNRLDHIHDLKVQIKDLLDEHSGLDEDLEETLRDFLDADDEDISDDDIEEVEEAIDEYRKLIDVEDIIDPDDDEDDSEEDKDEDEDDFDDDDGMLANEAGFSGESGERTMKKKVATTIPKMENMTSEQRKMVERMSANSGQTPEQFAQSMRKTDKRRNARKVA